MGTSKQTRREESERIPGKLCAVPVRTHRSAINAGIHEMAIKGARINHRNFS